ncbi:MAG: hypothetical protein MZV63_34950 [Marinilabiliales bacterium]|nr:hypothetical protein [Marinilabiliales bacterium]
MPCLTDETGREIWKRSQEAVLSSPTALSRIWDVDLRRLSLRRIQFLKLRITYVSTGLPIDDNTYWFPV